MKIFLRLVGLFLIVTGALNFWSLTVIGTEPLSSPTLFVLRNTLLVLAGVCYLLLLRWGAVIYFASLTFNWIAFMSIFNAEGAISSLWLTLPIPIIISVLSALGWSRMNWTLRPRDL